MKKAIFLGALLVSTAAWAQAPAEKKEPAKVEAAKPAPLAKKSRRQEDARHCLERATNSEIIKCAEAYL